METVGATFGCCFRSAFTPRCASSASGSRKGFVVGLPGMSLLLRLRPLGKSPGSRAPLSVWI